MGNNYQPLEVLTRKDIPFPVQQITSGNGLYRALGPISRILEQAILDITHYIRVEELTYQASKDSPISEDRIGYVRFFHPPNSAGQLAGKDSIVIVLPQKGGKFNGAQLIASYLASHGISAVDMELPLRGRRLPPNVACVEELHPTLDMIVQSFGQAVGEVCSLTTTLIGEGYTKIGICGVSMGALFSSIAYGTDKRLHCACLIMAGGDLTALIRESKDALATHLREYAQAKGMSWDTVRDKVKPVDPLTYADSARAENLLMIRAVFDHVVLNNEAQRLRKAWGNPREITVNANHLTIAKHAPYLLGEIYKHFSRRL